MNNGNNGWTLVGPTFNAAEKTGAEIEYVDDADAPVKRPILSIFVKTKRVVIISDYQFTPKSLLSGFKIIKQGINLSTANLNNNTNETKFWGVAEKAEALISGDEIVSTTNFLRSDQNSTTNFSFNVRNNNGINIGNDLSFSLGTDTSGSYVYNKVLGASIDIRLRQSTQIKTVLRASINDQTNTGSVGINNSISTTGGINVALNALVGGSLTVSGLTRTTDIEPVADSSNTLGTETRRWDTVYAVKIGTQIRPVQIFGTVTGSVNGDVSGFSGGFKTGVTLTLQGDIQGTINIKNDGELKNIDTLLKPDFINQRTESSTFLPNDLLLIERNQSLFKIRKNTIVETLPLVPTATILLFAGNSARVPDGYLICNGEEHSQSIYNNLFSIIGYDYKPQNQLVNVGTFAVPDLTPPSPEMRYIIYTGNIT
ncbi:tail fiber protein [bacterium]|nr:tail fiber protein [Candidatus Elulimicrobium humile]